jgi:hypothetical protein
LEREEASKGKRKELNMEIVNKREIKTEMKMGPTK